MSLGELLLQHLSAALFCSEFTRRLGGGRPTLGQLALEFAHPGGVGFLRGVQDLLLLARFLPGAVDLRVGAILDGAGVCRVAFTGGLGLAQEGIHAFTRRLSLGAGVVNAGQRLVTVLPTSPRFQ